MEIPDGSRCPNPACGEPARPEDRFCEACGSPLPARVALIGVQTAAAGPEYAAMWEPAADPTPSRDHVEVAYPDLAGVSDRGLKRYRNEDALALARLDDHGARILVVCDGVSSSAEPAAASQAAADAVLAYLVAAVRDRHPDPEEAMRGAMSAAQAAVCIVPWQRADGEEAPATTVVAALIIGRQITIAWVGDSRAYFIGVMDSWQLSTDDTWAADQIQFGLMGEEEAMADPRAHALTSWVGAEQDGEPVPSIRTFTSPTSGCILLCSDGLWNYAPSPERMRELLTELPGDASAVDVARGLTEFARALGGMDNITVAVGLV